MSRRSSLVQEFWPPRISAARLITALSFSLMRVLRSRSGRLVVGASAAAEEQGCVAGRADSPDGGLPPDSLSRRLQAREMCAREGFRGRGKCLDDAAYTPRA